MAYHCCPITASGIVGPVAWLRREVDGRNVLSEIGSSAGDIGEFGIGQALQSKHTNM